MLRGERGRNTKLTKRDARITVVMAALLIDGNYAISFDTAIEALEYYYQYSVDSSVHYCYSQFLIPR